ncbi:MAG: hypothetical protein HMLIMOIP_001395 [Candidatus Nitrosomirales archaeon]|jgi:hypothetical protein
MLSDFCIPLVLLLRNFAISWITTPFPPKLSIQELGINQVRPTMRLFVVQIEHSGIQFSYSKDKIYELDMTSTLG